MEPAAIVDRVDGVLHEKTQVTDRGVDLSLATVETVREPGRVDFGGGELATATLSPVETALRNPDDEYEWWNLDGGQYLISYNETVTAGPPLVCEPRPALRERGAFHPTTVVPPLGRVPLAVPDGGIRLKENARVSTLRQLG